MIKKGNILHISPTIPGTAVCLVILSPWDILQGQAELIPGPFTTLGCSYQVLLALYFHSEEVLWRKHRTLSKLNGVFCLGQREQLCSFSQGCISEQEGGTIPSSSSSSWEITNVMYAITNLWPTALGKRILATADFWFLTLRSSDVKRSGCQINNERGQGSPLWRWKFSVAKLL